MASEYRACTCIFPPCYPTSELESSRTLCSHSYFFLTFSRLESSQTKKNMATKLHESYLDIEKKLEEINGNYITDHYNVMLGLFDVVLGKGRWMLFSILAFSFCFISF